MKSSYFRSFSNISRDIWIKRVKEATLEKHLGEIIYNNGISKEGPQYAELSNADQSIAGLSIDDINIINATKCDTARNVLEYLKIYPHNVLDNSSEATNLAIKDPNSPEYILNINDIAKSHKDTPKNTSDNFYVLIGLREIEATASGESDPFINHCWTDSLSQKWHTVPTINDNEEESYNSRNHFMFFPLSMRSKVRLFNINNKDEAWLKLQQAATQIQALARGRRVRSQEKQGGGTKLQALARDRRTATRLFNINNKDNYKLTTGGAPIGIGEKGFLHPPSKVAGISRLEHREILQTQMEKVLTTTYDPKLNSNDKKCAMIFGSHKNFAKLLDLKEYTKFIENSIYFKENIHMFRQNDLNLYTDESIKKMIKLFKEKKINMRTDREKVLRYEKYLRLIDTVRKSDDNVKINIYHRRKYMDRKNKEGVMQGGPEYAGSTLQNSVGDTEFDTLLKEPMEFKGKSKFLRWIEAKPLKLGINNNAILMFQRTEYDNKFKITVINQDEKVNADKDKYEYIENIKNQGLDTTNSFQIRLMNDLGCFDEIKSLMYNLKLDRLILVRHGISVHSLLDDLTDKLRNLEEVRNSKLLPTQMSMDGPIFKQAHKLWSELDGHSEHKLHNITFNITHFCSDLIRTQQSLMTFKCAYDYYKEYRGSGIPINLNNLKQVTYYNLYKDCIKTSIINQMKDFYYKMSTQKHKHKKIFNKQSEYIKKLLSIQNAEKKLQEVVKQISNDDDNDDDERENIFDTGMELINSAENTEVGKPLIDALISNKYMPQGKYELVKDHVRRYNEIKRKK